MADEGDIDVIDPRDAAESAGLVYVTDDTPGITRHKAGEGFRYSDPGGETITDQAVVDRVRKLAIPPAYTDVWICANPRGHIQATGRDARGRKQYRYHPVFRETRDSTKYSHVAAFAGALPTIRARVLADLRRKGLPRDKVLATIVYLLESTLIRVGNEGYVKENKSYGLTTLRHRHVNIEGSGLHFEFKGKSNKMWKLDVRDRRIAGIVRKCQELPGQHLFQYVDSEGGRHSISSQDVNAYLHKISGQEVTAKDFRTWAGTVLAALALSAFEAVDSQAKAKKNIRAAIERVAARLGNTATICRKCYIHPTILDSYMSGDLLLEVKREVDAELRNNLARLTAEEAAVLGLLEGRLKKEMRKKPVSRQKAVTV